MISCFQSMLLCPYTVDLSYNCCATYIIGMSSTGTSCAHAYLGVLRETHCNNSPKEIKQRFIIWCVRGQVVNVVFACLLMNGIRRKHTDYTWCDVDAFEWSLSQSATMTLSHSLSVWAAARLLVTRHHIAISRATSVVWLTGFLYDVSQ